MAEFRGFECDNCGVVVSREQVVKHTDKYEGAVEGEHREHLCVKCADEQREGKDLQPLRRRKTSGQNDDNS